jgi:hypothetical protein
MDPMNCAGSADYPYSVYFVSMPVFHFPGARWPLGVELQIWSAVPGDSCAGPQEKLYARHYLLDSASFIAPHVGVIRLDDPVCVSGPFFVSIEYDGRTPQPYPSMLFDTIIPPSNCLNWGYRDNSWLEWNDFWTGSIAGNFMVWVDGFSNSAFCGMNEDTVRTIPGLHGQLDSLSGRRVSVVGYYTDSAEGKLVAFHPDYLSNSPLPPRSETFVIGPQPNDSFAGSLVMATGYLQNRADPAPLSGTDQDELLLYAPLWQKVMDGPADPKVEGDWFFFWEDPDICRPGKAALLIGGGPNETNNHRRYWREMTMAFSSLHVPFDHCPENVFVRYADGIPDDPNVIPQSFVEPYTKSGIDSMMIEFSRMSASRIRQGLGGLTIYLFISGQSSPAGLVTQGGTIISVNEMRGWVQRLVDSAANSITVDITTSYGGALADSLRGLASTVQTQLQVMSAAGNSFGWSGTNGSPLWQTYRDTLWSNTYSSAYAAAPTGQVEFLDSLRLAWIDWKLAAQSWLLAHPPGSVSDTLRAKVVADTAGFNLKVSELTSVLATPDALPWLWERSEVRTTGERRYYIIPQAGQATITFTADTSVSGSVTVYEDTIIAGQYTATKSAVWTWNVPGSAGYQPGNANRVYHSLATEKSSIWMHADEAPFGYTIRYQTNQPDAASTSNPYDLAGFSMYTRGQYLTPPPVDTVIAAELPGVVVSTVPAQWGGCGCSQLVNQFTVPFLTPWHADMEVRVYVNQVVTPGSIDISIQGAANSSGTIPVTTPGLYRFDCGAFGATGAQELIFSVSSGCFVIGEYSLRSSLIDPPPSCCQGTTGNVNGLGSVDLSDLSMMIGYLIGGIPSVGCAAEADLNNSGKIDLTDLSLLIAHLVMWAFPFSDCP